MTHQAEALQMKNNELENALNELKNTQEQLMMKEKMAALGGLVAGVAHEISTPLGIGVTAASHLQQQTRDIETRYQEQDITRSSLEDYLQIARESTVMILENLKRAADNMKSFKQMAVDQTHDTKRVFNLKQCIDNVLLSLHPKLKTTQHMVTVQCADNLEIDSYPGAFSQIITNFVMNSLIHGFENHKHGQITLQIRREGEKLQLIYGDNGKGMSEQEQSRIFEPFYTTKRDQGGSGLGLHIVYNLVTQTLEGEITCESAPGSGTTFLITIPMG
jgi:signal transduction histidine kinase